MVTDHQLEHIACPCCGADEARLWCEEEGFRVSKCSLCGFLYLNPRPSEQSKKQAISDGRHSGYSEHSIVERRNEKKIRRYKRLLGTALAEFWNKKEDCTWLDVGCGYGEVLESVTGLATPTSRIVGVEPMPHKANQAQAKGLSVHNGFISDIEGKFDFISLIDVFSHLTNPDGLFSQIRAKLNPGGTFVFETGNLADLEERSMFPGDLGLPEHVIFGGRGSLETFLSRNNFTVEKYVPIRIDGFLYFAKNIVKKALGRSVRISLPYSSPYRSFIIIAKPV